MLEKELSELEKLLFFHVTRTESESKSIMNILTRGFKKKFVTIGIHGKISYSYLFRVQWINFLAH